MKEVTWKAFFLEVGWLDKRYYFYAKMHIALHYEIKRLEDSPFTVK